MKFKTVYIAHPYGGELENLDAAEEVLVEISRIPGIIPIAPWIPFCRRLEETEENRARAMAINKLAIANCCDEVWLTGPFISPGMREERDFARGIGLEVLDYTGIKSFSLRGN